MLERLFDPTVPRLESALDAGSLRQRVIANNLANVNTPGFKASDVVFADALNTATLQLRRPDSRHAFPSGAPSTTRIIPSPAASTRPDGNNVDVEHEMTSLAETELRYAALTQFVGRYFSALKTVINGQAR